MTEALSKHMLYIIFQKTSEFQQHLGLPRNPFNNGPEANMEIISILFWKKEKS